MRSIAAVRDSHPPLVLAGSGPSPLLGAQPVFTVAIALARQAAAPSFAEGEIAGHQRMPAITMRQLLPSFVWKRPPNIFRWRYRLKMLWITAFPHPAEMVNMETGGDRADKSFVSEPVRLSHARPTWGEALPISVSVERQLPNPTRRRVTAILNGHAVSNILADGGAHLPTLPKIAAPEPREDEQRVEQQPNHDGDPRVHGLSPPDLSVDEVKPGENAGGGREDCPNRRVSRLIDHHPHEQPDLQDKEGCAGGHLGHDHERCGTRKLVGRPPRPCPRYLGGEGARFHAAAARFGGDHGSTSSITSSCASVA